MCVTLAIKRFVTGLFMTLESVPYVLKEITSYSFIRSL
jgi:hypothetical protein